ncbi:uncharacterized protein LOC133477145 isoform X2 [Phyllopteryx taeniolatus]|uniref:uncharacterized protein LOC133477145 isoform X2 n=1 Tax=Phyllopteryx taeniolatus TaxID=161469 RepID=UPI002AD35E02|nr:uncharacterized protein LOC133477145 isoform X2 [Phyllopteryx taeniolatus]
MPQYSTDFVDQTEEAHENICSTNGPKSPDVPVPCSLKEPTVSRGHSSAASRTSINGINGYLNHVKDKATNAAHVRNNRKQRSMFSAAGGVLVNGNASEGHVLSTSEQPATERDSPLTTRVKNKRWSPGWRRKNKRREPRHLPDSGFECTQCILRHTEPACPKKPALQPPEEEDWDKECEANLKRFSGQPYGPEDLFVMAFGDLTLEEEENVARPAGYSPAMHHPHPLPLLCFGVATEPEQFSDADEFRSCAAYKRSTHDTITHVFSS